MQTDPSPSQRHGLINLARVRFPHLSQAEGKLLRAAPEGRMAWCGPSRRDDDPANDPSGADAWGPERTIRADLLRWLCVDRDAKNRLDPRGIQVHGAKIGGGLDLSFVAVPFPLLLQRCRLTDDADLSSVGIPALYLIGSWVRKIQADGARVKGDVFLSNGFRAEGQIRLLGAEVGGTLNCVRGTFKNPPQESVPGSGMALFADRISVKGSVFLRHRFQAEGEVRLLGAEIGSDLDCSRGTFKNPPQKDVAASGDALSADRISVKGGVYLRDNLHAEGAVRLLGAQIGGNLDCSGGTFSQLDLRNASAGAIADDESSWPTKGNLLLEGFLYGRITGGPTEAGKRLEWLCRQVPFKPQPYRQLAKVLTQAGDDGGARRVLFEMEDRLWEEDRSWVGFFWRWPLRLTVGYGYYPLRSLGGLALVSALGWIVFRRARLAGAMAPRDEKAYEYFKVNGRPPANYESFVPLVYSVENSLPLVKLGQAERWHPDPDPNRPRPLPPPGKWISRLWRGLTSPRFLFWFLWVQILLGWILATLFIAGVTGIVRKD